MNGSRIDKKHDSGDLLSRIQNLPWDNTTTVRSPDAVYRVNDAAVEIVIGKHSTDPKRRAAELEALQAFLPAHTVEELSKLDDTVFEWLGDDPAKLAQLIADPISTLAKANVKLSPSAQHEIQKIRNRFFSGSNLQALELLSSLRLKIARDGEAKDKNKQ